MTTSAQALNELMTFASSYRTPHVRFVSVIAEYLGYKSEDADPKVVYQIFVLIKRIENEIEILPHDEKTKDQARRLIAPFRVLKNLQNLHLDINTAKKSFLSATNLVGLTNLHMALSGHVDSLSLDKQTRDLATKFREISVEVRETEIPNHLKKMIFKRSDQIASILDRFELFGAEALQEEVEALVGAIVINPPSNKGVGGAFVKKICITSVAVLAALKGLDAGLGTVLEIADKSEKLIEVAQEVLDENEL